jgi:hypothetical protein
VKPRYGQQIRPTFKYSYDSLVPKNREESRSPLLNEALGTCKPHRRPAGG